MDSGIDNRAADERQEAASEGTVDEVERLRMLFREKWAPREKNLVRKLIRAITPRRDSESAKAA